jgi:hypothetical protein
VDLHAHDYMLGKVAHARLREARAHAARHRLAQLGVRRPQDETTMTTGVRDVIHAFIAAWRPPTGARPSSGA